MSVPLTSTISTSAATLGTFTVQAPGNGNLTINVSGLLFINADASSANALIVSYFIGLNTIPASLAGATYMQPYVTDPDNFNGDNQTPAYSINATYPVVAGANTFYIIGATSNSSFTLFPWTSAMVTVLFTPGTLSISSPTPANPDQKPPKQE
jgi:hypothetical protein